MKGHAVALKIEFPNQQALALKCAAQARAEKVPVATAFVQTRAVRQEGAVVEPRAPKALGLEVPAMLLARAEEVIE